MNIGEKIKKARTDRKMTQSELAGDKITRNMLSAIERGKATPSIDTIGFLADRLRIPVEYFISPHEDLSFYVKKEFLPDIKSAFVNKQYKDCIELISGISAIDDELYYILAACNFEIGISAAQYGSFSTATSAFEKALEYSDKTIYDTSRFKTVISLYQSVTKNINAPLLELDIERYESGVRNILDYDFYKYVLGDTGFTYYNQNYKMHLYAKSKIKERKYTEAIEILREIESNKNAYQYNVYLMLGVYADLDYCYKQICDFENAYRYSTKRITLIENLNS